MSYPNIPNITPEIDLSRKDVINLLLASIALEELGLSHIINAEAEKIQYVLGTLNQRAPVECITVDQLLKVNRSVELAMRNVIKKEMLLQFKLEDVISLSKFPLPPPPPPHEEACSLF